METDVVTMDKIVSLSKRRGFVFPSSEIYGGLGSSYDYGHYGVLLKNNVKGQWWRAMLQRRDDIVALDSAIIQHPETWRGEWPPGRLHRPARRLPERASSGSGPTSSMSPQCGRKPLKHPGARPPIAI